METLVYFICLNVGHLQWNLSRDTGGDLNLKSSELKEKCVTLRSRSLFVV